MGKAALLGLALPLIQYGLYRSLSGDLLLPAMVVIPLLLGCFLLTRIRPAWGGGNSLLQAALTILIGIPTGILLGHYGSELMGWFIERFQLASVLSEVKLPRPEMNIPHAQGVLLFILAILVAPVLEEIWFRGLTLTAAMKCMGLISSLLFSAFFFSMAHIVNFHDFVNFVIVFPSHFMAGIILGIIQIRYGLLASIAGHSFGNLLAISVQTFQFPSI